MERIQTGVNVTLAHVTNAMIVNAKWNSTLWCKVNKFNFSDYLLTATIETWLDRAYLIIEKKFQKEDEKLTDTRLFMMGRITYELQQFKSHNDHVEWWKVCWPMMKKNLLQDQVIIRWDYIGTKNILNLYSICFTENYVHDKSYAMSFEHFGKKQTTLLIASVFYKNGDGELQKCYYDFVSEYLGHNNIFYEKCLTILLDELAHKIPQKILYNVSDGGNHFVSRYAFWDLGIISREHGNINNNFILAAYTTQQRLISIKSYVHHSMAKESVMGMVLS
jgi:hypothetical protein